MPRHWASIAALAAALAACGRPAVAPLDDSARSATDTSGPETVGSPCDDVEHPAVVVNEVVTANVRGLTDDDGDSSDWIELINLDSEPVDLDGWGLSDDEGDTLRWRLPAGTLEPGELLLVFASGKDRYFDPLHTNFGLDATGEPVILSGPDGCTADRIDPGRLYRDVSYGRPAAIPEELGYFIEPTPEEPNTSEWRFGFAPTPSLEPPSGFHGAEVEVTATTDDPDAVLRISFDASVPDEDSQAYVGPFTASSSSELSVVRVRAWSEGLWPSRTATATYSQDTSILDDDLKVVSLVVDPFDLYDEQTGIYTYGPPDYTTDYPYFGANFWEDWERDLHVEIWDPDGTLVIDQDAGVKIHGGYTRAFEQKSFRLLARTAYGPDSFSHRFFPEEEQEEWAVMVLEGAGDWCPAHTENSFVPQLLRDGDGVRFPTIDAQAWEPCVVYLNGEFWGLYAFREKLDEHFIAAHHGADPDNLDRVECTADGTDDWWRVLQGDWEEFEAFQAFISAGDFSDPAQYADLEARADLPNLASSILAAGYWGNTDWWNNNLKLWRERSEDGRWRWMVFDFGHGWTSYSYDHIGVSVGYSGRGMPIADALESETFQVLLANQAIELLNTSYSAETALARLDTMHARIEPVMPEQYALWCGQPVSTWYDDVDIAREFAQLRPAQMMGQVQRHLGLEGTAELTLEAEPAGAGSFQLTLIEVDAPHTGTFWTGIPITVTAMPAEGYSFAGWDDDALGTEPTAAFELDGARTVVARFE